MTATSLNRHQNDLKLNKIDISANTSSTMLNEVDNHKAVDFVTLSGTKLRELLANGQLPPAEVVRPEVAEILIDFYKLNK